MRDIEKLIDDHWDYVKSVLDHAHMDADEMDNIEFHYKTAFEHGWKHGMGEKSGRINMCKRRAILKVQ